jgi:hypothetical protein
MLIRTITLVAAAVTFSAGVSAQKASTTITGCVYQEKDVPGRAPNPAERAGILEDYILAEITPAENRPARVAPPTCRKPTRCTSSSTQLAIN